MINIELHVITYYVANKDNIPLSLSFIQFLITEKCGEKSASGTL